jgi:hypothetical protein
MVDPMGLQQQTLQEVNEYRVARGQAPYTEEEWARMNNKSLKPSDRSTYSLGGSGKFEGRIESIDTSKHLTADSFREKVTHTSAGDVKVTENWAHVIAVQVAGALLGGAVGAPASAFQTVERTALTELEEQMALKAQQALRWRQAAAQAEEMQVQTVERWGLAAGSRAAAMELPRFSKPAEDLIQKGLHIHSRGVELAVKTEKTGTIFFETVNSGVQGKDAIKLAHMALENPDWQALALREAQRALTYLQGAAKSGGAHAELAAGRQAELHFVIKALEKMLGK